MDPQASGSGGVRQPRSEPVNNANTLEDSKDLLTVMTSSGPSVAAIFAAKTALRQTMRARLANLNEGALASQSAAVTRKVLQHPWYQQAQRLSIYISMPTSELRTDAIVLDALAQGKEVFIPFTPRGNDAAGRQHPMQMLRLADIQDFKSLLPNRWKIREFLEEGRDVREHALDEVTTQGLDLVLVPGLAFDKHRDRLGHGRGYYDAFLTRCLQFSAKHGHPPTKTIALALDEQVLESDERIPTISTALDVANGQAHEDLKPDAVLFPSGELSA